MTEFSSPAAREEALNAARQAFDKQQWSQASSLFERLYTDDQTPQLNHKVVASLYYNQQYLKAEQLAAEQDGSYLDNEADFQLRLDVALENQQFIFAREFCMLPAAKPWRQSGLAQITQAETRSQSRLGEKQRIVAKQFYHLGDVSFLEQRQRLEQARQLPLDLFMQGVQYLLVDPFLHPLMRATLLEELLRLRVTATVKLHWLDDQVHTLKTQDLRPVNASRAAAAIQTYLQGQLGQQDPILAANLQQTVTLQLMMLYPFIDRVITYPQAWVQLAGDLPVTGTVSDEQLAQIRDWQARLNKYLSALLGE